MAATVRAATKPPSVPPGNPQSLRQALVAREAPTVTAHHIDTATCRTQGPIETFGEERYGVLVYSQDFTSEVEAKNNCPSSCSTYARSYKSYWYCECGGPFCSEQQAQDALNATFPENAIASCGHKFEVREQKEFKVVDGEKIPNDGPSDKKPGWYVQSDGCTVGRPLLHESQPLLARLVMRSDWSVT